jgi:hypothetical protein
VWCCSPCGSGCGVRAGQEDEEDEAALVRVIAHIFHPANLPGGGAENHVLWSHRCVLVCHHAGRASLVYFSHRVDR